MFIQGDQPQRSLSSRCGVGISVPQEEELGLGSLVEFSFLYFARVDSMCFYMLFGTYGEDFGP